MRSLSVAQTKRLVIAIALTVGVLTAGTVWWGVTHPTPKSLQVLTPARTPGGPATVRAVVHVEGMTCEGCVASVTAAIEKLGVDSVSVSLEEKQATIVFRSDKVALGDILSKIQESGYTPKLLE
ncbi:MAG: heavy-metal-associated domain-containing protein [Bryobacterales bacterium]|nr:heavy-metal-associated domain-containing protein [Bryobacterales bacterium]